ncbi:unnamed protein product [Plasmodium vivax]|uniref:(malaria parasite P. vivax) hypothetical protein n=1 Tax=Plasmodium vivax TaxID=5855 RepID=A0A8S4H9G5_PLAVI|nr:unnamed protein product [Plasmodium vivax]
MAPLVLTDYDFFNEIETYLKNEQEVEKTFEPVSTSEACDSFKKDSNFDKIRNPEIICKKFKNLFNTLSSFKSNLQNNHYNSDCRFINYWLNNKLRNDSTNDLNYVKKFYVKLKEDNDFDKDKLLNNKIYDINYGDLKNLRVLYNLYDNLYKIIALIGDKPVSKIYPCSFYTNTCIEYYKEAKIFCNDESSTFCKALDEFRASYISVQNDPNDEKGCHLNTLGKLPEEDEILSYRSIVLGGKRPWTKAKVRKLIKGDSYKKEWENQLIHSDIEKEKVHLDKDKYNIEYRSAGNL